MTSNKERPGKRFSEVGASRGLAGVYLGHLMAQKCNNQPGVSAGWWGGSRWHNGRACGVDRVPKEEAAEEVSGVGAGRGLVSVDLGHLMAQKRNNQPGDGVGWWGGSRWRNGCACGVDREPEERRRKRFWWWEQAGDVPAWIWAV